MDESQTIRVSVEEAATLLGIEKGSVKKRIQRGKLRSEKDVSGTTWVYLDRSETVRDQSRTVPATDRDELVVELRDRVRSLERRLDEEGESRRRADTIIAQLTQATTALTERLRELESPQTSEEAAEGAAEVVAGLLATQGDGEATEGDTGPRWMRSRWANWLIPGLFAYVLPIVIAALGSIYVYIRAVNDQAVAAVLGAIISGIAVAVSLSFYWWFRRQQRWAEAHTRWLQRHAEGLEHHVEADSRFLRRFGEVIRDIKDNAMITSESLDKLEAELERRERRERREEWIKERLKEEPELEQRMEELREEYEKEHPS